MSTLLRFDRFEVDLAAGHLLKGGTWVHLREKDREHAAGVMERVLRAEA